MKKLLADIKPFRTLVASSQVEFFYNNYSSNNGRRTGASPVYTLALLSDDTTGQYCYAQMLSK